MLGCDVTADVGQLAGERPVQVGGDLGHPAADVSGEVAQAGFVRQPRPQFGTQPGAHRTGLAEQFQPDPHQHAAPGGCALRGTSSAHQGRPLCIGDQPDEFRFPAAQSVPCRQIALRQSGAQRADETVDPGRPDLGSSRDADPRCAAESGPVQGSPVGRQHIGPVLMDVDLGERPDHQIGACGGRLEQCGGRTGHRGGGRDHEHHRRRPLPAVEVLGDAMAG